MARATIYLTNGVEIKKAPVGFSWTVFFFGGIPALFRQDWLWGIGLIIANMLLWGFAGIIAAFFYNKVYIKSLIEKGYTIQPSSEISDESLKNYLGFIKLPGRE